MASTDVLEGKRVLVVDDEPDIVESVADILDMCELDTAADYETASEKLRLNQYDIAVLDIMGVGGYELLALAKENGTPAVMLTAHALTPDNFAKSMDEGACAYLPKDSLSDLDLLLTDIFEEGCKPTGTPGKWFDRLRLYFEKKFGPGWIDEYKGAWH